MDGARGSALEWALALLYAPGERHVLRQKPLPAGVDRLLGIAAGGSSEALADAVRTFGESEGTIREAARFYAREVLFFPQADAYRVLGLGADASAEQIKNHHRLLQHWLHPDRLRGEDDAVFAARVNTAWNHLRNSERRKSYDEFLRQNSSAVAFDANGALRAVHAWVPEAAPPDGWRKRLPMLALSVACIVLALLVLRDMEHRPEAWDWQGPGQSIASGLDDSLGISVPFHAEDEVVDSVADKRSNLHRAPRNREGVVIGQLPRSVQPATTPSPLPPVQAALALPVNETPAAAFEVPAQPPKITQALQAAPAAWAVEAVPQNTASRSMPSEASLPSFSRIQSARHAGDQFLRYMEMIGRSPPPIWNSPAIQSSADRMRHDLHHQGHARLAKAQWRIGNETAVLSSGYKRGESDGESGVLIADMIWREGRWLVTGVSMEEAR